MSSETIKVAELRSWLHRNPQGFVYTHIKPFLGSDQPLLTVLNNKHLLSTLNHTEGDVDIKAKKMSSFEFLLN